MDEYIEREMALKAIDEYFHTTNPDGEEQIGVLKSRRVIIALPAADVAPVRHGRWDSSGKYRFQKDNSVAVRCTECGSSLTESEYRCYVWNYCPVCGAKMDLDE